MLVVIGTTTVDLLISGFDAAPAADGDEFTINSLVFCEQPLLVTLGGNGANSAYVLATLGADVHLMSAAGTDPMGEMVSGWLKDRGVKLGGFLRTPEAATATTTALTDQAFNRISYHHAGASHVFQQAHIVPWMLQAADMLLLTGPSLLPRFHNGGFEHILRTAHSQRAVTAIDIGPAVEPLFMLDMLLPLLPHLDYVIANQYELLTCTGADTIEAGAEKLLQAGARCVVLKQGAPGALAFKPGQTIQSVGHQVEAAATVGAGDSFNAGLLFALYNDLPLNEALHYANATAALVLQSGRGVLGAPTREAVNRLVWPGM